MGFGSQLIWPQNPLGNPTNIPLGPLTPPAQDTSWSMILATGRIGKPQNQWTAADWELAARYLASALDTLAASERATSQSLVELRLANIKQPRGRPRKHFTGPLARSLAAGLLGVQEKPKGKPGRRKERDFELILKLGEWAKKRYGEAYPGKRVTVAAALRYGCEIVAKEKKRTQSWARRRARELAKDYSDAKRFVEKSKGNS